MWFLVGTVLVLNGYLFFMKKKLSGIEMLATTFFAMMLQDNVNIYLDLNLDWYGYFEKGPQWETLIAIFGVYPAVNIIFLNYYPFDKGFRRQIAYIAGCTIFALVYEWTAVQSGYFYHNGWKYWHSAICYPILFYALVLMLKCVRRLVKKAG